jgi:hypothetical protein
MLALGVAIGAVLMSCALHPTRAVAEVKLATPADYRAMLAALKPGDRLSLAPGVYREGLTLRGMHGTARSPIVIEGPADQSARLPARANRNVVSLRSSSHLVIRNLLIDLGDEAVDAVKAERSRAGVHHIVLENLMIVGRGADQESVGISTKAPATSWRIRNNLIVGVGTGLYLGDSDGSAPFVAGIIEGNVVVNPRGYCLQIKHQIAPRESEPTQTGRRQTIIRRNFFSKAAGGSMDAAARPNVLIGHLPPSGSGAEDHYLVAGNVFFANPAEALFQGEGNLNIHHNLFLNPAGPGINVRPHNAVPRRVDIRGNFVVTVGTGIHVEGVQPGFSPTVVANRVHPIGEAGRDRGGDATAADWVDYWTTLAQAVDAGPQSDLRAALRAACGGARVPGVALIPPEHFVCAVVSR